MRLSIKIAITVFLALAIFQIYGTIYKMYSVNPVKSILKVCSLSNTIPDGSGRPGQSLPEDLYPKTLASLLKEVPDFNASYVQVVLRHVVKVLSEREGKGNDSSQAGSAGPVRTGSSAVEKEKEGEMVSVGGVASTTAVSTVKVDLPVCPDQPPGLVGVRTPDRKEHSVESLEKELSFLKAGGSYSPPECKAKQKVAIIIPYRNRWQHLHILLQNLVPFLVRQQADFTFFVIEQEPPSTFNRALLLNVGVLESDKRGNYTCIIFHDVDLVPLDDHNFYRCGANPRHMAVGINKFRYNLPYIGYVGGASALSRAQVQTINGNSNVFFGWGGEDDDLWSRVEHKKMKFVRYPAQIARYDMIRHPGDKGNEPNPMRIALLKSSTERMDVDGLNSVRYRVSSIEDKPLYTWIKVSVNETEVLLNSPAKVQQIYQEHRQKKKTPPKQQ